MGKIHFDRSFLGKMKKARSLLQNFGQWITKNGRQVFWLACRLCRYSVVREFKSIRKGKIAILYLQICIWKSRCLDSKKPRYNRGFCGTYLFYVPIMVEHRGFEPLTPTLPVWCAPSCANAPLRCINLCLWFAKKRKSFFKTYFTNSAAFSEYEKSGVKDKKLSPTEAELS